MSVLWVFLLFTVCAHSTRGQLPRVRINDCGGNIVAGQSCTLVCTVTGVGSSLLGTISYQWTKNNDTTQTGVGNNSDTLSFPLLRLSDAGRYTCQVTVGSKMYGYSEYIGIQIPAPVSVNITSIPASPIRPIGTANVTLTCTIELSEAIDVSVTVNTMWSGPDGFRNSTTVQYVTGIRSSTNYMSTVTVSSFGRNQSGNYTCKATLSSSSLFLISSEQNSTIAYITVGVYLSLKSTIYANNSIIFSSMIGESYDRQQWVHLSPPNSLQCITDRMHCCRSSARAGEWYFPNASHVPKFADSGTYYRTRGDDGSVHLNRRNDSETGLFCCVVPDAIDNTQTVCANIVSIRIIHPQVNTAGRGYSLGCVGDGMTRSINYHWLDMEGSLITTGNSISIIYTSVASIILFSPLHQSHEGNYTCNASTTAATVSKSFYVSVNVPLVSAQISGGGASIIGLNHTLICNVLGTDNLNPNITYKWIKNSSQFLANSSVGALSFLSLQLSDAGEYTCWISVRSPYLRDEITDTTSYSLILELPAPESIATVSNKPNPIRPIGSTVTLSCIVELSPAVDVPVNVNIQLRDPAGRTLTTTLPLVSGSSYTATAMISSFGRSQSGIYTCTVNVSPILASPFITDRQIASEAAIRVTAGVYLTFKGVVYPNNSLIPVKEVGHGLGEGHSENSVKCVTDRKPCCGYPFRVGRWYFPDGSEVPIPDAARYFYRLRSDSGFVYLNRLNSNVTHPVGQFCCAVPDANDDIQTLCVNIIPSVSVWIHSNGTPPTAGQKYSLTCNISGAENLDPSITYKWLKTNGTQTHIVGTNSNILSFSSLRLSDAGKYFCEVVVNSYLLHSAINETSRKFELRMPVPEPIMRLVSDTPNPILSGSTPTLTCAVELSPAVDVPVTVNTEWTGPDGSILTSGAPPVMRSFTHYTSKAKLNYVESADSGSYTCTVSIRGKIRASVSKVVVMGDGMFQIRLKNADICQPWYKSVHPDMEAELYKQHIKEGLVEAIESLCECHLPRANLLKASFSCGSSPNLTTYRNTLIGTHNFNATQLIGFIQDWVTSEPQINIKDYSVWLDSSCPVAIASLKEPECGEVRHCPCAND